MKMKWILFSQASSAQPPTHRIYHRILTDHVTSHIHVFALKSKDTSTARASLAHLPVPIRSFPSVQSFQRSSSFWIFVQPHSRFGHDNDVDDATQNQNNSDPLGQAILLLENKQRLVAIRRFAVIGGRRWKADLLRLFLIVEEVHSFLPRTVEWHHSMITRESFELWSLSNHFRIPRHSLFIHPSWSSSSLSVTSFNPFSFRSSFSRRSSKRFNEDFVWLEWYGSFAIHTCLDSFLLSENSRPCLFPDQFFSFSTDVLVDH